MKIRFVVAGLAVLLSLWACATPSDRLTEYLSGFQLPSDGAQPVALPLSAGLVVVLPENELGKPTTPSREMLQAVAERLQKEIQMSPNITIQRTFPSITIPANGLHGLSLEQLQSLAREGNLTKMLVVVATSRSANKLRFWPIMENQLYVRMDAALVDVPTGRVLTTESGEDDYVMAEALDYVERISYPRLYYRNFTFGGPFTIVTGDPYKALGEQTFRGAADQLGMKLRHCLDPERTGA
ncbi:MAG TPA: hypothetical protein VE201_04820 [Nitrospirales bacterium]|nr:hypothetical protein [Nitrospirales bacterium]